MLGHDTGRERIQAYVVALAGCVGMAPEQLSFKWELIERIVIQAHTQVEDKVHAVRVYVNKYWTTLVFTDFEMGGLEQAPEQILLGHRTEILEAIRRLTGLIRPIPEMECQDRLVTEGDTFPGQVV